MLPLTINNLSFLQPPPEAQDGNGVDDTKEGE